MGAGRPATGNLVIALVLTVTIGMAAAAKAQTTPDRVAQTPPLPIEIEAEQGIEWFRDLQIVYARGNARATRGDLVVTADVLGARYRDTADGSQEVWQLDATGNVKIASPGQTGFGDSGVYDMDSGVLRLYGSPTRLVSGEDTITANREIEYATRSQVIVARGDAAARQGDRLIKADEITAHLGERAQGGSRLQRLEADRNVSVITPKEVVRGNRGDYNVIAGTAVVTGDVKITRGPNQLSGCRGEIDIKAGVSRLMSCGKTDQPVRGLILPGASGNGKGAAPR